MLIVDVLCSAVRKARSRVGTPASIATRVYVEQSLEIGANSRRWPHHANLSAGRSMADPPPTRGGSSSASGSPPPAAAISGTIFSQGYARGAERGFSAGDEAIDVAGKVLSGKNPGKLR